MNHRHIDYNWRATMGNADALSPAVCAYLDLVTSLAQDDGHYPYRTANLHTCAIDDPMVILHHVRNNGLCTTPADHKLFDQALAEVRQHRSEFFCDAEVERRMKQADGSCPMCGFELVFHTGDYGDGYQPMMTHCQHNLGHRVRAGDIDAYLRRASTWQGKSWPYGWMSGHKLTLSSGKPLSTEGGRMPCPGCQQMEAYDRMEAAITKLVTADGLDRFAKPGWSSPVSEFTCKWPASVCSHGDDCDHVYMQIKRTMAETHDSFNSSTERRLNGAGLKLYLKPARMPFRVGEKVTGHLRVGGDQANDYAGFQDYAHQLFNELGVPTE